MTDDLTRAIDCIDDTVARLEDLRRHLPLIHEMAFTTSGKHADDGSRATKFDHYGDEAGDARARKIWTEAKAWLGLAAGESAYGRLIRTHRRLLRLLDRGKPDEMRGVLVSRVELEQALAMQRKRAGGNHPNQPEQP